MASEGPQSRARGVDQDAIEMAMPLRPSGGQLGRIRRDRLQAADAQSRGIGRHPLQTSSGAIHRPKLPLIADQFGEMGGLSPGGCAGIQNPLPRSRSPQGSHPLSRAILHRPMPHLVAGPSAQITAVGQHLQTIGTTRNRPCRDLGSREGVGHLVRACFEPIDP